jgi:hypothetical protein
MAASTANMVKSKSGKMYDASSSQGKVIVTAATTGKDADFDSPTSGPNRLDANASMAETLQAIYGETQDSAESLDNIEEALVDEGEETAAERAARLEKSNKDKKPNKFGKAIGVVGDKLKSGFGSVKESLSGKFGLALLGGGLLLLNKYGDEIAGPDGWLTKFLKYMKEGLIPDVKALYEDLQEWWPKAWAKVTSFFTYINNIFSSFKQFILDADTDKDGVLSKSELDTLVSDIWGSIKDSIWNTVKAIGSGVSLAIIATTIAKGFFAGRAIGAVGGLGFAGLAGIIGLGVWKLTDNIAFAWNEAVTDEITGEKTEFNGAEFVGKLLGGKDRKGGWRNALNNAWDKALIGAGTGAAVGSLVPGIGTAVGAISGFLIGGVLGYVLGDAGSDKITAWSENIKSDFDFAVDSIGQFFVNLVNGLKSAADPDKTFMEAFKESDNKNINLNKQKLAKKEEKLVEIEKLKGTNENQPFFAESLLNYEGVLPQSWINMANNATLFGRRLSEDVDGAAEAALKTEVLILGNEIKKAEMILQNVTAKTLLDTSVPATSFGSAYIKEIYDDLSTLNIDEAEMAYIAGTQRPTEAVIKTNKLNALQNAKNLMYEIKTQMVSEVDGEGNKTPGISLIQDKRSTETIINQNVIGNMNSRNDFWNEYYGHKVATN